MAIYVTSDLHGLPPAQFKRLLDKVDFGDDDWLYILGDVIDRQHDGGVEMLVWLQQQPNMQLILGNHEAMLLSCAFVFEEITHERIAQLNTDDMDLLTNYMQNGGDVTLRALRQLKQTAPHAVEDIFDYLREAPLYETMWVGGRDFLLCHAGLSGFDPSKRLCDYTADDVLWTSPTLTDAYFDDVLTVFGHTPTLVYGEQYRGRALRTDTWIDIDVGVAYGHAPMLLRLDDLEEYYL